MFGQQGTGLRVTKLLIQDTGTYNQQWRRPYNTEVDGSTIELFKGRLESAPVITAPALAGIAGQFIRPQAQPEKMIEIPGGWAERRMRFMMEVVTTKPSGGRIVEVVLGYTDYAGVATSGAIDPNMNFFINSIIKVRDTPMLNPFGMTSQQSVIDSSHVLARNDFQGVIRQAPESRMRPQDVFVTMSRAHLPETGDLVDTRITSNSQAAFSKRSNSIPAKYLASLLHGHRAASLSSREMGQADADVLSNARAYVAEQLPSQDDFLMALAQVKQMPAGNTFSYRELLQLQPDVDQVAVVAMMGTTQRQQVHQANQTADWGSATRDTQIATYLSNAVPGLMMELALTKIAFMTTNHNIGGQVTTAVMNVDSISNIDQTQSVQMFIHELEHSVLNDITQTNQLGISLKMQVDLLGETWINMSIDGGAFVDYVTPSFCDALTVPVLTTNTELAVQLASDVEILSNEVTNPHGNMPTWPSSSMSSGI